MIVDEMHEEHPELLRDQYWECVVPKELPYTVASEHYRREEPKGSAENYKIKKEDAMYANIVPGGGKRGLVDDVYADYVSIDNSFYFSEIFITQFLLFICYAGERRYAHGGATQTQLASKTTLTHGLHSQSIYRVFIKWYGFQS